MAVEAAEERRSAFGLDDFGLYNCARQFRRGIYSVIRGLPEKERYCLDQQMRRAAVSITNNIAEGHGRWHYQDTIRFCEIARGSTEEIIDDLNVCIDEGYGDLDTNTKLKEEAYGLVHRVNSYIAYLRKMKSARQTVS